MAKKHTKESIIKSKSWYGGSLNYRKIERPLNPNKALHLTLRANIPVNSGISLRKKLSQINKYLLTFERKFEIKIYKHNINSNHIHLIIRATDRSQYTAFIKALSGSVALLFKRDYLLENPFWLGRPFSRFVNWGREFKAVCSYIHKNFKEVVGFQLYDKRITNYPYLLRDHHHLC